MNKIAVVTGGSRGLGRSAALLLAERGMDVVLTYRTGAKEAAEVVSAIEARGRRAKALPLDAGTTSLFPSFVADVERVLHGWDRERFDVLVNNAGGTGSAPFEETTEALLDELYTTHLKATFFLSQKLLPLVAEGGRIINVSTGLTRYTFPGQAAYGAVKAAVDVLTRYMARELGARNITVNVVAPGGIETDIGGGVMRDPALKEMVAASTALGRMGQPDDVAGVVAMLASDDSRWITGQRIEITGGFLL